MWSLAHLRFRLVDRSCNRDRAYELDLGRDLFDRLTVTARFGRQGSALRAVVHAAATIEDAQRIAAGLLRRRLSARRRLGSAYVLLSADGEAAARLVGLWQAAGGADRRRARAGPVGITRLPATSPVRRRIPTTPPPPLPLFAA
ncbi:MAG: hypothetical protein NXI18_21630 [Alphaproteobacteria bacterium]|nr:hypothetical protein [Alphaproteobacteria bacterium]